VVGAGGGELGALAELGGVERHEVAALPVGLEHRRHPADHLGVADARHPHVPLQPRHHRAVRQVRRADVRRGAPAGAVEQPRLRVQARGRRVVRDPHLHTRLLERGERLELGAVRVGGGEQAHLAATVDVTLQRRQHRPHTRQAHERHQHVDPMRRRDLADQLVQDRRLPRRVHEQRRVVQRRERPLDRAIRPVGQARLDHRQRARRLRQMQIGDGLGRVMREHREQVVHERRSGGGAPLVVERIEHHRHRIGHVTREPSRRIPVGELGELRPRGGIEPTDQPLERDGDQVVVQPRWQLRRCHRPIMSRRCGSSGRRERMPVMGRSIDRLIGCTTPSGPADPRRRLRQPRRPRHLAGTSVWRSMIEAGAFARRCDTMSFGEEA
jgi:hypothetical protein